MKTATKVALAVAAVVCLIGVSQRHHDKAVTSKPTAEVSEQRRRVQDIRAKFEAAGEMARTAPAMSAHQASEVRRINGIAAKNAAEALKHEKDPEVRAMYQRQVDAANSNSSL